jgi:hypothetical protein
MAAADNGPLKIAGLLFGLVAGIVALAYFIGAGVIATRLFADNFAPDEVVGVIGELPKTVAVTLGFIEGIGVALALAILTAAVFAAFDWPRTDTHALVAIVLVWLFGLGCLIYPIAKLGWSQGMWILVPLWPLAGIIGTFGMPVVCAATTRLDRFLAGAVVITAVGIPLCVMWGPIVGFPSARVCLRDDPELTGSLVANTKDRVVLIRQTKADRKTTDDRTIDTIPGDTVARVDYGDLGGLPPCP